MSETKKKVFDKLAAVALTLGLKENSTTSAHTAHTRRWFLGLIFVAAFLHRGYFSTGYLVGGDSWWFAPETLRSFLRMPATWDPTGGLDAAGLGYANVNLNVEPLNIAMGVLTALGLPFEAVQRLLIFFPAAFLPSIAMFWFAGRLTDRPSARFAAGVLFGANTYLMTIGVQHLYLVIANGLAPFVWGLLLVGVRKAKDPNNNKRTLFWAGAAFGLMLSVSLVIDARVALLTLAPALLYTVLECLKSRDRVRVAAVFAVGMVTTGALHLYWILPMLFGGGGSAYSGVLPTTPFVPFADFSHALALNHPFYNGGEPDWFVVNEPHLVLLGLPLLAFIGFCVADRKHRTILAVFAFFAILGVFLAKGQNAPAGAVFTWAFDHVPGMNLYRDPLKFMTWIAAGYSVLIAMAIDRVPSWWSKRDGKLGSLQVGVARDLVVTHSVSVGRTVSCAVAFIFFVAVTVGAGAWIKGDAGWTTTSVQGRADQIAFAQFLANDESFGRVLWLPLVSRYSSASEDHPRMAAVNMQRNVEAATSEALAAGSTMQEHSRLLDRSALRNAGVKYIALDTDFNSAYWTDMFPFEEQRQSILGRYVKELQGVPSTAFGPTFVVYSLEDPIPLLSVQASETMDQQQSTALRSAVTGQLNYTAQEVTADGSVLRFSQSYDSGWRATIKRADAVIPVQHFELNDGTNAWRAVNGQSLRGAEVAITYAPQRWANAGAAISLFTFLVLVIGLIRFHERSKLSSAGERTD